MIFSCKAYVTFSFLYRVLPMCNIYIRVMNMFVFSFFGLFLTRISINVSLKGRSGQIRMD